jgi:hypothetical protein
MPNGTGTAEVTKGADNLMQTAGADIKIGLACEQMSMPAPYRVVTPMIRLVWVALWSRFSVTRVI